MAPDAEEDDEGDAASTVSACPYCGARGTRADEAGREFCQACGERIVRFPGEWD